MKLIRNDNSSTYLDINHDQFDSSEKSPNQKLTLKLSPVGTETLQLMRQESFNRQAETQDQTVKQSNISENSPGKNASFFAKNLKSLSGRSIENDLTDQHERKSSGFFPQIEKQLTGEFNSNSDFLEKMFKGKDTVNPERKTSYFSFGN